MKWFPMENQHRDGLPDSKHYYATATLMHEDSPTNTKFLALLEDGGTISIGVRRGHVASYRPDVEWLHFDSQTTFLAFADSIAQMAASVAIRKTNRGKSFLFGAPNSTDMSNEAQVEAFQYEERNCPIEKC